MCALSHHIREKPNWWEKVKEEAVVGEWREEALKRECNEAPSSELTQEERFSLRELFYSRRLTYARRLTPTMVKFRCL